MKITNDIIYVGVNDKTIDLFEGHYNVPRGMAYNSYVIVDEKIAVMDAVDARFGDEWLDNIAKSLDGKAPDYLVVQHMEPDHSANIPKFLKKYPAAQIVTNAKAAAMINNFFGVDISGRAVIVENGGTLALGRHTLTFVFAPMVHWPEVMMTYDSADKVLFSADAFGKFGALDADEPWDDEARRYYIGIVGKYGAQVQAVLKKAAELDVEKICPLHGPVLAENLDHYIKLYSIWSSYEVESDGVVVAYTSVYGNTKRAAQAMADKLRESGAEVKVYDLARSDMAHVVAEAFRYGKLVLATTTYNGDIFPYMREFIDCLCERGYKNRTVAFIENGSWAPVAAKVMKERLAACKNLTLIEPVVSIKSGVKTENEAQIAAIVSELVK